uniref:C3H1-type domain-containing protein n=1 Tax=Strongyloides papillosus TaxID=174720 RepID=A0A0N5B6T7_STREA
MFHGANNPMEGMYNFPPTPSPVYSFSTSPIGYMGPPQTSQPYPTAQTIFSPMYYLPSVSPPLQQPIGAVGGPTLVNIDLNHMPPPIATATPSPPTSIPHIEETSTTITPPPTKEDGFINGKVKEIDKKPTKVIDEASSTLLVTDRFAVKLEPNKYINGIPATKWYTLSDEEREEVLRNQRRVISYKTALCVTYRVKGTCPFGDKCRFAHNLDELKPPPVRHPKYKTQLCDKFSGTGICPYGSRCNFIHAVKGGEVISDYKKYLASKEKVNDVYDEDSDYEDGRAFAASMNSIPKRYNQRRDRNIELSSYDKLLKDNNKPAQVINFSKSYGAPMIRTLYEKGTPLKDDKSVRKSRDINRAVESLPQAPSPSFNSSVNETKENSNSGKNILEKLFRECRKYSDDGTYKEIHSKKAITEDDVVCPSLEDYTSSYLKKNPLSSRNTGYYSQSKLPTFFNHDNT